MTAKPSLAGRRQGLAEGIFARAMFFEAFQEASNKTVGSSEMYEHAWDPNDCSPTFIVLHDRLTARRQPSNRSTDCIRGKIGYRDGRHVWEIKWENEERGTFAIVGVATPKAPLQSLGYEPLVGNNSESWGWDIVNKTLWHCGRKGNYPVIGTGFKVPDIFFVILDMDQRTLSFSTSDVHLGVAFTNLPKELDRPMCPIVSAIFGNCDIRMRYMGNSESLISNLRRPLSFHRATSEAPSPTPRKVSEGPRRKSTGSPRKDVESPVVEASNCYQFVRHKHGKNVAVMYGGKKAKRVDPIGSYCDGVVVTSEPLKDNELFEVRLDSKVERWNGSLGIGATSNSSDSFDTFPKIMVNYPRGSTFMWADKTILFNNDSTTIKEDTGNLTTGDRVGVMRKSDNSLHFFLNGKEIGNYFKTIPDVLYGVVDIYGQAEQVTITGGTAETETSNDDEKSSEQVQINVMVQMKKVIQLLKLPIRPAPNVIIKMLYNGILKSYTDTKDRAVHQRYGDHLADIGAVPELKKFLERLDQPDLGIENDEEWIGMSIMHSILWNYSDCSLKIAKEIGNCGLLERFVNDLKRIGPSASGDKDQNKILISAVNILHNCAKATENRQVFRDINAVEILAPFLKCEDSEIVVCALLTMSYIIEEDQRHLLEADTKTIFKLRDILVNAANSPGLRSSLEDAYASWSAFEIVCGIAIIAVNENNRANLIYRDVIPPLFDVIKKGGPMDKECSANALWVLASAEAGRKKIRGYPGAKGTLSKLSKDPNKSIAAAAKRVLLRMKQPMQQGASLRRMPRKNCAYKESCRSFLATLNLNDVLFDHTFDKCYCTECHASRNEKLYYTQGNPAKDYSLPIGWARFALKMERTAALHNCNKDWHVAFHSTSSDSVRPILEDGKLLMPGDETLEGRKLSELDGHFNDDRKPEGFNTKQIFVSPSIRYSGLEVYAKSTSFKDPQTGKTYKAKTAFQLWIKPDSYKVGQQTVGATKEIDPKFSNQEIEWSTARRSAIHLYGVLVRLEE